MIADAAGVPDHPTPLPLVSVITPVFGVTRYLAEAIESVRAQSHPRIEHLVIDDGSPEPVATDAFTSRFPWVRWLRQPNAGPSRARNLGIQQSAGAFLVFLDADDLLGPDDIRRGLEAIQAAPDIGMVFGETEAMDPSGESRGLLRPGQFHLGPVSYEQLLTGNIPGVPVSCFFRRTTVEAVGGFDEELRCCEDYDLYLRLAKVSRVVGHPHPAGRYRVHPEQSSRNLSRMMADRERIFDRLALEARGQPHLLRAIRKGRRWDGSFWQPSALHTRMTDHIREGRWLRACGPAIDLLRTHPRFFMENLWRKLRKLGRRGEPAG
jgi:glycosyltransferase involved in cell wall biosynthesis